MASRSGAESSSVCLNTRMAHRDIIKGTPQLEVLTAAWACPHSHAEHRAVFREAKCSACVPRSQ